VFVIYIIKDISKDINILVTMSLKANTLKSNESQNKSIMSEVNSIISNIDDELKVAHEQGRHKASITVPITFSIPYMQNKDAQRTIYYKILTSLLDRDFHVTIQMEEKATIFHVKWLSDEEEKDIDLQNTLLAKHTVSRSKNTKTT
jgi:hypothetical protein